MKQRHIMYVCGPCLENNSESCGHFDRDELVVTPSGEWMCDSCYENDPDNDAGIKFSDLPIPPEYKTGVEWHPYPEKKPTSDKVREYMVTSHETVTIAKFPVQHWMSGKLQSQYDEFEEIRSEMLEVTAWAEMPEPYRNTK